MGASGQRGCSAICVVIFMFISRMYAMYAFMYLSNSGNGVLLSVGFHYLINRSAIMKYDLARRLVHHAWWLGAW